MGAFTNPFRPGAGHQPPYLAGRHRETDQFKKLLQQETILENLVLTGLRGVGKTVLLESFKPVALEEGWLWIGMDINESSSFSEENLAIRLCADLSVITKSIKISSQTRWEPGFTSQEKVEDQFLSFELLQRLYQKTPGLPLDKLKALLQTCWEVLNRSEQFKGIVFAYDEAQNLSDHSEQGRYPLSLLLDAFQSLQKMGLPLMLALSGLPTLFPKLVESRTFSERMFRIVFVESLSVEDSREAILKPIEEADAVKLSEESVAQIIHMSKGYPYFIQYICREVYDAFMIRWDKGEQASVPVAEIEEKLDTDFFAGRCARTTDRQRELLSVIAGLQNCDEEFTVQEIVKNSRQQLEKPFSSSSLVNQMLAALAKQGLVFKNRHGKYSFAVPLLGTYIRRQLARK